MCRVGGCITKSGMTGWKTLLKQCSVHQTSSTEWIMASLWLLKVYNWAHFKPRFAEIYVSCEIEAIDTRVWASPWLWDWTYWHFSTLAPFQNRNCKYFILEYGQYMKMHLTHQNWPSSHKCLWVKSHVLLLNGTYVNFVSLVTCVGI